MEIEPIYRASFQVGPVFLNALAAVLTYLRHSIAVSICTVAALGHAPAWLHVTMCGNSETASSDSEITPASSGCGACCNPKQEPPSEEHSAPSPAPHDSDSCVICQSLACPLGSGWIPVTLATTGDVQDRLTIQPPPLALAFWAGMPRLRGPPVSA